LRLHRAAQFPEDLDLLVGRSKGRDQKHPGLGGVRGPQWECVARHRGEALSALSSLFAPCDWVGSSGLCRPYFRLAIGSALSAFVVPIFALRLGRL
jgi:hypothetical protein